MYSVNKYKNVYNYTFLMESLLAFYVPTNFCQVLIQPPPAFLMLSDDLFLSFYFQFISVSEFASYRYSI